MKRTNLFVHFFLLSIALLGCQDIFIKRAQMGIGGVGIEARIPIWKPETYITTPGENYEEERIMSCVLDKEELKQNLKRILLNLKYSTPQIFEDNIQTHKLLETNETSPTVLQVIIIIDKIKFNHHIYRTQLRILVKLREYREPETREVLKNETANLIGSIEEVCSRKNEQILGFVNLNKQYLSEDEKKIYNKFGEKALVAIKLIDGKNDIKTIIELSGMDEKQFFMLLEYLVKNNYIEIIDKKF